MKSSSQVQESLALAYWTRAVGALGAKATRAEEVRDGVLFVATKSSVWSHELMLHKKDLLGRLNRLIGASVIKDIHFRVRPMETIEEKPEPDSPAPEDLAAVLLEPAEKAELRGRLQSLISIADDRARTAIASRMTLDAKLRHWRLERGWRVCLRCSALHKTDSALCPICRLSP